MLNIRELPQSRLIIRIGKRYRIFYQLSSGRIVNPKENTDAV